MEGPAFKRAAAKRRCLIAADGWFEWQHNPDRPGKQPFYMSPRDGSELAFAIEDSGKPDLQVPADRIADTSNNCP